MHLQTLSSGSAGNSTLIRAGDTSVLVDAGLPFDALKGRLDDARVSLTRVDHVVLTHGHLDHARSAGELARKAGARLHCSAALLSNRSVRRAPAKAAVEAGRPFELAGRAPGGELRVLGVRIPHDADPTLAFRIEHGDRRAVILTDMGRPDDEAARHLAGAHVLVLEFNHDERMLREGPYPARLKRRIGGPLGHLSNDQARAVLRRLAGPELHTLVLAHLSAHNNAPVLAEAAARATLAELGRPDVRLVVAGQHAVGPNLRV